MNLGRSGKFVAILIGAVILTLLVLGFNSRVSEKRRLSQQEEQMDARLKSLERTRMSLETQIAYATSEAAVEEWAYEQAKMIREGQGDHLLVPLPGSGPPPESTPEQSVEVQRVENWQVWWKLFFDRFNLTLDGQGAIILSDR